MDGLLPGSPPQSVGGRRARRALAGRHHVEAQTGASAADAIPIGTDGRFAGSENADLNVYTGTDVSNLGQSQQGGSHTRSGNTISRHVNAPNAQFIFFSLAEPSAQAAPALQHYTQTRFRVDDQMVSFFQSRGAVDTFGYPVSRVFLFLGCPVQLFQRLIIQMCGGQGPVVINLLDPEIFPYTRVNGSVFPSPDEQLKQQTPAVGSPEYANIISLIQSVTPDQVRGQPVNFWQTFQARGALEVLGAPISRPQPDPSNAHFIYMRFQRVILHYRQGIGTEPLLLADYLKQVILGPNAPNLPQDLQQQASSSRVYAQYCKGGRAGCVARMR